MRYFGRPGLTRWIVPVDDTNTMVIAWRHYNDRDDPRHQGKPEEVGLEKTDFYGQSRHRSDEMRHRNPGDYEAWTSQGPITSHEREHLATTDRGIGLLRHKLRQDIRNLKNGIEPLRPTAVNGSHVPTYGGDTILHIPAGGADDTAILRDVSRKVFEAYVEFQDLPDEARRVAIARRLVPLNVGDTAAVNPDRGKLFEFKPVE